MFKLGLESMAAVTKSKLGSELEAMFQEVIDYRDKDLKGVPPQSQETAIQVFFAKRTAIKFMDSVYRNTGLRIISVIFKPKFQTSFCTWICIGKGDRITSEGTEQLQGILTGQANALVEKWFKPGVNSFTCDELIALAKSYDVEKGIIRPEMREQIRKWVKCGMGFDLSLGFMCKEYLPTNSGVENFTARELAAIMLHEIGHNLTLIEHAADMYARVSSFNALKEAFKQRADVGKAVELAKKVATMGTKAGYTADSAALMKAALQAEKDIAASGSHLDQRGKTCFIFSSIEAAFTLLFYVVGGTLDALIRDPSRRMLRHRTGQKVKLGDIPIGDRAYTWQERKADEYAFTHGYGADQVDALARIMKVFNFIGRSPEDIDAVKKAEAAGQSLGLFTQLRLSYRAHAMMGHGMFRLYPPGSERFRDMLELTIKELKAHGASGDYVAKYTDEITRLLNAIDNMSREDKYFEAAYNSYKTFLKFCSIRSFVAWFTNGRVDTELQELSDNIRKLNNSVIGYYGARFEQIANKEK